MKKLFNFHSAYWALAFGLVGWILFKTLFDILACLSVFLFAYYASLKNSKLLNIIWIILLITTGLMNFPYFHVLIWAGFVSYIIIPRMIENEKPPK